MSDPAVRFDTCYSKDAPLVVIGIHRLKKQIWP
jgi:hypothetical protein